MPAVTRRWPLLGVVVIVTTALAGCGGSDTTSTSKSSSSGGTITLYNGQHEELTTKLVSEFEQQTGIKVKVRNGEEPELANQLAQEGSASPADVFFTENTPPLTLLDEKGLLAKIDPATLKAVPARDNSPAGAWVGVAARETALDYDPKQVTPAQLPKSILDLASPAWKGKLAIAPDEVDFQPVVSAVAKLKGQAAAETWLKGFAKNAKRYNDNEGIVAAVERGQIAAGIVNHYYWFRAAEEKGIDKAQSKLYYFGHQDPGALIDISAAGIMKSSKHQDLAQKFVRFLVSRQGQEALVHSGDWEYPVVAGIAPRAGLKPFDQLDAPNLAAADLGDGRNALALLQQAGLL